MPGSRDAWMAQLASQILEDLKATGSAAVDVSKAVPDETTAVRSLARRIGREQGWKVKTLVTDTSGTTATVHILVSEAGPMLTRLWETRRRKAMRRVIRRR